MTRALRAAAIAAIAAVTAIGLVAVAAAPAAASPKPPAWVRRALDATRKITRAEGSEDVEVKAAGQRTSFDNAFTFDTGVQYFSSDITTGDSLDAVLTVYASGGTAWVDVGNPAFRDRLPEGKRFATIPVGDLTAAGLASTDPNVYFAPLYILLGATHARLKPLQGAGHHVYAFDVDLDAAKRAVPDDVRDGFLQAYGQIPTGKRTRAHGSATVDDQHHVLEFEARFDVRTPAHPVRFTVDLLLHSVDVSVETVTPPDSASVPVDSVPGLREQLQRLTGTPAPNPVAGSS